MIPEKAYLWRFPEEAACAGPADTGFTDPFRYIPDPLVKHAGHLVISRLAAWARLPESSPERALEKSFSEGKMLGVLICRPAESRTGRPVFIAAFSGTVKGPDGQVTATVQGFVPPIIDLTDPKGYFKRKETAITLLNKDIEILSSSDEYKDIKKELQSALSVGNAEIESLQNQIRFAKMQRDEIRSETADPSKLDELIRESQFQKAELKRCKDRWKARISELEDRLKEFENTIGELKSERAAMSDELQKWIFENATVHNAAGESSSIWNIFAVKDMVPPGGTGDCAAPKLLNYAFTHGLEPLAMGEFWYGASPDTAVRTHGHFYPSCTSKCGPLLGYMMKGLRLPVRPVMTTRHPIGSGVTETSLQTTIGNLYEDASIIVVEKPGGMPSVPGLDGRISLQEVLDTGGHEIHAVHRLDMDTSGVMVFAKTAEAAVILRRQFEEHTVRKTYMARISASPVIPSAEWTESSMRGTGAIDLPLSPDYDERPRQKVDFRQGKPAHTEYETVRTYDDGTADILLHPHTGRTHQLRVHCAHHLGLGSPIVGDLLYGGHSVFGNDTISSKARHTRQHPERLCLHALSITFRHPVTGEELTFTSDRLSY